MAKYRKLSKEEILAWDAGVPPLVVVSDNLASWISRQIKRHTKGNYNHAMVMHAMGLFASQGIFLRERPVADYLRGKHRVKFWRNPNWSPADEVKICLAANNQLEAPWYKRRYDILGILGQAVRIPWINRPGRNFCSESVAKILKDVEQLFHDNPHPSPADIDRWCEEQEWEVVGVYEPEAVEDKKTRIQSLTPVLLALLCAVLAGCVTVYHPVSVDARGAKVTIEASVQPK